MPKSGSRAYGIALVTLAAVLWSMAGVIVRFVDLDVWTVQLWRSVFGGLSLVAVVAVEHGRQTPQAFLSIGWPGLAAIPIAAISMIAYMGALELTTVANVLIVYATVPFLAAGVAYVWIGERVDRRTLIAAGIALVGVVVMAGSATRPEDVAGAVLSFVMTLTFAVLVVMARRWPSLKMAPINAAGAALLLPVCWWLSAGVVPGAVDLAFLAILGVTTLGLAYLLFLTGSRHIPASEAGLIALLDVVLGPLWVWIAFAEDPGLPAIVGGAVVLGALVWYLGGGRRRRPVGLA